MPKEASPASQGMSLSTFHLLSEIKNRPGAGREEQRFPNTQATISFSWWKQTTLPHLGQTGLSLGLALGLSVQPVSPGTEGGGLTRPDKPAQLLPFRGLSLW